MVLKASEVLFLLSLINWYSGYFLDQNCMQSSSCFDGGFLGDNLLL